MFGRLMMSFALCATLAACGDKDSEENDSPEDTEPVDTGSPPVSFSGSWVDQSTYTLTITNGVGAYEFGMAQTGASPNWYGEDCQGENICHPTSATGLTLTSVHPVVGGGGIPAVVAGSTTLFYADQDTGITYFFRDPATGDCSSWGQDTSYYAALGCTAL